MDTAIKLFGKTIPLQPSGSGDDKKSQDLQKEETSPRSNDQGNETPDSPEKNESTTTTSEIHKPASTDQEDASTTTEEQAADASNSKDKTAKKPDKILPCPRCKSLDTKFCYYNNYNVNQPRHFCKNCQRYWTAGGTMRNVPVGAGRRKSKNSSHYRHIAIAESSLHALRSNSHEPVLHYPSLKPNGTVLSFGTDALSPAEKTKSCNKNGLNPEMTLLLSTMNNGDEHSNRPPVMASKCEATSRLSLNEKGSPIPCFNGSPWTYPWTPAPFPIPFYPAAAYWSCAVQPGTWSIPWLPPVASSAPNGCYPAAGSNSTLGKHSRDGNMLKSSSVPKDDGPKQVDHETCVLIPKTLRIDDPEEAARSSIWTMVGIKGSNNNAVTGGGLLKAFQPKVDIKNHVLETASLLHANPAALSRSLNFQETS